MRAPGGSSGENNRDGGYGKPWTFSRWAKARSYVLLNPPARLLQKAGVHPNTLSIAGFALACGAGVAVGKGNFSLGGWLFLLSGPFDALDGALARMAGLETRYGAFLDSFLDRYADASVLLGLIYWSTLHDYHVLVMLSALGLVGSIMVSYARARAEGLDMSCSVGLFTRLERFVLLVATLFSTQLLLGISLLAVMSNITAVQRMYHVYRQSRRR